MVNLEAKVVPNPAVLETAVDGEAVMMHIDLGRYFTLNRVGTEIWDRLKNGSSVGEVCRELAAEYEAPLAQIETETRELVEELLARGLATLQ